MPPANNTIKPGDSIKFRLSFGCDTGANIFLEDPIGVPNYPRIVGNVSCDNFYAPRPGDPMTLGTIAQLLPQGSSWS
jgi:hypothetical protein